MLSVWGSILLNLQQAYMYQLVTLIGFPFSAVFKLLWKYVKNFKFVLVIQCTFSHGIVGIWGNRKVSYICRDIRQEESFIHFYIQYNSSLWISPWPFQGRGTVKGFPNFSICIHYFSRCISTCSRKALLHSIYSYTYCWVWVPSWFCKELGWPKALLPSSHDRASLQWVLSSFTTN